MEQTNADWQVPASPKGFAGERWSFALCLSEASIFAPITKLFTLRPSQSCPQRVTLAGGAAAGRESPQFYEVLLAPKPWSQNRLSANVLLPLNGRLLTSLQVGDKRGSRIGGSGTGLPADGGVRGTAICVCGRAQLEC